MAFRREDTATKVISIVEEKLGRSSGTVQESDSFESLGADSLDLVELIMTFEEEFGIIIKDEDVERLKTMSAVIDYVQTARTK